MLAAIDDGPEIAGSPLLTGSNSSDISLRGLAVGVPLAVSGNVLIACSLALQKYVHNRHASGDGRKPVNRSPLFWLALSGMILGEVGNFTAFGFASPTVVSPLGAVAVITNAVLAVIFLGEAVRLRSVLGLSLTLCGTAVVVVYSPPTVDSLSSSEFIHLLRSLPAVVYLACVGTSILLLGALVPRFGRRYLLINLMLCSLLGSITVLCSSVTSKFLKDIANGDYHVLLTPLPYVVIPILVTTAVLQLHFLNKAMGSFDATQARTRPLAHARARMPMDACMHIAESAGGARLLHHLHPLLHLGQRRGLP